MQALESQTDGRSAHADHLSDLRFADLSLAAELERGIAGAGFTHCTPIQSMTLPIALAGRDVAGQAQTGTGKTAAYLIALYQFLLSRDPLSANQPGPRALIVAPTRELAVQIHADATALGAHLPFKLGLAFGGTDYEKQRKHLSEGVDVLVGTPGRIIDFFKQGVFALKGVQVAVLDEADRMFDLGFLRDIRYILRRLPPPEHRLNLLFSATLSYRVLELAYEHMNDPELVRVEPDKLTVDRISQSIYFPSNSEKLPLLIKLLRDKGATRTMIFVNTRREAERLSDHLVAAGIQAAALSGDVPQRKRLRMLNDFQAGELAVLIGTDVASRGLHVPDVSHVFNYDLPQDPEDYVHRIGRTARAGASGDAISFGCEDYVQSLPDIEAYIARKIPVASFDHADLPEVKRLPRRPSSRRERRPDDDRERRGSRSGGAGGARRSGGGSGGPGGGSGGSGGRSRGGPARSRRADHAPGDARDREHIGERAAAHVEPAGEHAAAHAEPAGEHAGARSEQANARSTERAGEPGGDGRSGARRRRGRRRTSAGEPASAQGEAAPPNAEPSASGTAPGTEGPSGTAHPSGNEHGSGTPQAGSEGHGGHDGDAGPRRKRRRRRSRKKTSSAPAEPNGTDAPSGAHEHGPGDSPSGD